MPDVGCTAAQPTRRTARVPPSAHLRCRSMPLLARNSALSFLLCVPLEVSSRPLDMWLAGKQVPLTSRQQALFEKYRTLPK